VIPLSMGRTWVPVKLFYVAVPYKCIDKTYMGECCLLDGRILRYMAVKMNQTKEVQAERWGQPAQHPEEDDEFH